ncbi:DUF1643 domain-containing protein [uncultured Shimia sp.]|uniref:DUF1643 domain-containing protein n=1 Tax=uncultured Shimia sp. TaxID=573152 RepID=UPI00261CF1BE|nr:DUF1643 domain-containing protein [uncultured Shimia sp.]
MITRHHQKGDAASIAKYSDCETYRYALTRVWDETGPKVTFIMLNPSKATEVQNDPTIERCERRARALGFGGFCAVNIFALRETDPKKMRTNDAPQGPENDDAVTAACLWADTIIAGWGAHGEHLGQGRATQDVLLATERDIHCLGLTKAGHPRHPLYIAYTQEPALWLPGKTGTR